ncbi:DUF6218 family protein [Aquipuribacter sp. MA13-6]|uniref:DUF6218 family protein n=1 Tax=unclassified Aquipuribacter TaxID=2635084 RepID=UPI003EF06BB8
MEPETLSPGATAAGQDFDHEEDTNAAEVTTATAGPVMVGGRPTRAPLVVAPRDSGDGVALWAFTLQGEPCGAWISSPTNEQTLSGESVASLLDRRALLGRSVGEVASLLQAAGVSSIGPVDLAEEVPTRYLDPLVALTEIRRHRQQLSAAVTAQAAASGRSLAPLSWGPLVADAEVPNVDDLQAALSLPDLGVAPARTALRLVALARWVIGAWAETESARMRRPYLRGTDTDPEPLPPAWRRVVRHAYDS